MTKIPRGGTERARYWQRHLDRWGRSGLSQAEFCRRHGLKAVTFAWWKRKLATGRTQTRRRGADAARVSSVTRHRGFVEVEMINGGMAAYEVALPGGLAIRLPADFDPDKVSQLIAVVKAAC